DAIQAPARGRCLCTGRIVDRHRTVGLDAEHRGITRQQSRDPGWERNREALQCVLIHVAQAASIDRSKAHGSASRLLAQLGSPWTLREPERGRLRRPFDRIWPEAN